MKTNRWDLDGIHDGGANQEDNSTHVVEEFEVQERTIIAAPDAQLQKSAEFSQK